MSNILGCSYRNTAMVGRIILEISISAFCGVRQEAFKTLVFPDWSTGGLCYLHQVLIPNRIGEIAV